MKKKKLIRTAKEIRKQIKGLSLPVSKKLAKCYLEGLESDFLCILRENGFTYKTITNGYCPYDNQPLGHYVIYKNKKEKGKINFDCCGLYLD